MKVKICLLIGENVLHRSFREILQLYIAPKFKDSIEFAEINEANLIFFTADLRPANFFEGKVYTCLFPDYDEMKSIPKRCHVLGSSWPMLDTISTAYQEAMTDFTSRG